MLEEKLHNDYPSWYGMIVRMGRESDVKKHIVDNQIPVNEMIVPEPSDFIDTVIVGDKLEERYKYFLGYIFVKTTLDIQAYHNLLSLPSVYRFLGSLEDVKNNNRMRVYIPSRIPDDQMKNVQEYLDGRDSNSDSNQLQIGDEVEITSGDLASIKGKVIAVSNRYVSITPPELSGQVVKVPLEKIAICR